MLRVDAVRRLVVVGWEGKRRGVSQAPRVGTSIDDAIHSSRSSMEVCEVGWELELEMSSGTG